MRGRLLTFHRHAEEYRKRFGHEAAASTAGAIKEGQPTTGNPYKGWTIQTGATTNEADYTKEILELTRDLILPKRSVKYILDLSQLRRPINKSPAIQLNERQVKSMRCDQISIAEAEELINVAMITPHQDYNNLQVDSGRKHDRNYDKVIILNMIDNQLVKEWIETKKEI